MVKEIHGAPHNLRIAAFKNFDLLDEVDSLDTVADVAWGEIFEGVRSGSCRIAYWDGYTVERPGYRSFMHYALRRSTKRNGYLQLSVMEIRGSEVIPTSDTQHDTLKSLLTEVPNDAIVTIR